MPAKARTTTSPGKTIPDGDRAASVRLAGRRGHSAGHHAWARRLAHPLGLDLDAVANVDHGHLLRSPTPHRLLPFARPSKKNVQSNCTDVGNAGATEGQIISRHGSCATRVVIGHVL